MTGIGINIARRALGPVAALALALALLGGPGIPSAFAKGGAGGAGAGGAGAANANANSNAGGHGPGGVGQGQTTGAKASEIGNLNAAHAAPQGLQHASPNSVVGQLGLHANTIGTTTTQQQQEALNAIANKGPVSVEVVDAVNGLLGD
jgi:hypothetical protein